MHRSHVHRWATGCRPRDDGTGWRYRRRGDPGTAALLRLARSHPYPSYQEGTHVSP